MCVVGREGMWVGRVKGEGLLCVGKKPNANFHKWTQGIKEKLNCSPHANFYQIPTPRKINILGRSSL